MDSLEERKRWLTPNFETKTLRISASSRVTSVDEGLPLRLCADSENL